MEHQKFILKDIATIHSGYSFRTKIQNNPEGNTFVIQMRDISDDRMKITNTLYKIEDDKINAKYYLYKGDILFMAKGANNFSVCYNEHYKPAVAASAFFVIRPMVDNLLSSYLCWFMNNNKAQAFIESNRAGSYIPNVNKSALENMEIIMPPLETQKLIVELYNLTRKENEIFESIKEKRAILINSILSNLITRKYGN